MATIYRKTVTKPMPPNAEVVTRKGQRVAQWRNRRGKKCKAIVTTPSKGANAGMDRILQKVGTWVAKYRDGGGQVVEKSTGCRDQTAAWNVLNEWVRRAELVKSGVVTASQDAVADHQDSSLIEHITAYIEHQKAKGLNANRIQCTEARIKAVAADCQFARLRDMNAPALERWLSERKEDGMGPARATSTGRRWSASPIGAFAPTG